MWFISTIFFLQPFLMRRFQIGYKITYWSNMDSFKFWMKVKKGKAIIWYHLRYVRCLWKSKTPKELRGSIEEARGMMGSAVESETCLASNFPLFWKEHWVSHIPSESHHLQIIPEGVSLELCGVQLVSASKCYQAWTSDLKQPSFFFSDPEWTVLFLEYSCPLLGGGRV